MNIAKLEEFYRRNKLSPVETEAAVRLIEKCNKMVQVDLDAVDIAQLDEVIAGLVKAELNSVANFVVLMRYFKATGRNDLYIHLTKYTGMLGVMETIFERLKGFVGNEKEQAILKDFHFPYLGVKPEDLPKYTADFMNRLENNLEPKIVKRVLAGNNHNLSKEALLPEKVEYENSASLEEYLVSRHQRKVAELEHYAMTGEVWFEQKIDMDVVDFVRKNQEILSAVLKDDALYVTKIPYLPAEYLKTKDPLLKRYYACHCPFVRENIKEPKLKLSERFCYCSAGFAKFPFEVILDQELPVECLETALEGNEICRFRISLEGIEYKK